MNEEGNREVEELGELESIEISGTVTTFYETVSTENAPALTKRWEVPDKKMKIVYNWMQRSWNG